jgi:hypothetical protein
LIITHVPYVTASSITSLTKAYTTSASTMNNTPLSKEPVLEVVYLVQLRRPLNVHTLWTRKASMLAWLFSHTCIFLLAKMLPEVGECEEGMDQWLMVVGILTRAWIVRPRGHHASTEPVYNYLKSCLLPAVYMTALWMA